MPEIHGYICRPVAGASLAADAVDFCQMLGLLLCDMHESDDYIGGVYATSSSETHYLEFSALTHDDQSDPIPAFGGQTVIDRLSEYCSEADEIYEFRLAILNTDEVTAIRFLKEAARLIGERFETVFDLSEAGNRIPVKVTRSATAGGHE